MSFFLHCVRTAHTYHCYFVAVAFLLLQEKYNFYANLTNNFTMDSILWPSIIGVIGSCCDCCRCYCCHYYVMLCYYFQWFFISFIRCYCCRRRWASTNWLFSFLYTPLFIHLYILYLFTFSVCCSVNTYDRMM